MSERAPIIIPLRITRGETRRLTLAVKQADGSAQGLTGATLYLRIKSAILDDDEDAVKTYSTGDGIVHAADQTPGAETEGEAEVTVTSVFTLSLARQTYYYDAWAVIDGAPQPLIDPSPIEVGLGVWAP